MKQLFRTLSLTILSFQLFAQIPDTFQWLPDGSGYRDAGDGQIVEVTLPANQEKIIVSSAQLTPQGGSPL